MAKSTVNLGKRVAEMKFFSESGIRVGTPAGEGIFHGVTYSRSGDAVALAKVMYGNRVDLVPLSDVVVIKPGGAA